LVKNAGDASADSLGEGAIVSSRLDYTAEEWNAISAAPHAAQLYMTMASSNGASCAVIEPISAGHDTTTSPVTDAPELIRGVVDSIRSGAGLGVLQAGLASDRAKQVLLATIKAAVRAIELRSPVEVEPYKAWLASTAAKAVRHGPVIDRQCSQGELEEFRQLADVLAVGARQTAPLVPSSRGADTPGSLRRRQATAIPRSSERHTDTPGAARDHDWPGSRNRLAP
jgi:hypothetical protein